MAPVIILFLHLMRCSPTVCRRSLLLPAVVWWVLLLGLTDTAAAQSERVVSPKLAPTLAAQRPGTYRQTVRVSVTDKAAFLAWARQHLPAAGAAAEAGAKTSFFTVAGLSTSQVRELAAAPGVRFVDRPNRRAYEERQLNQSDLSTNRITPVHEQFPQLTGQGLTVSIKEDDFDQTDIDFRGRVLPSPLLTANFSPHATAIATLVGGGGNSAPSGKGVAWQARLATSSYQSLLPDDAASLSQASVTVQNHSYGVAAIENYYGVETQAYDQQCEQYPNLVHVFSSGNVGDQTSTEGRYAGIAKVANLTGQFKTSKNTLTVGATDELGQVAPLSSRGPAYDGRIKPELVAFGAGGTSESAALVSGISVLVQHAYKEQNGGALPSAALVKAILLNSADDTGRPGIDFESGFGQADGLGAVQTVLGRHYFLGTATQGTTRAFRFTVPAGQHEVKVTLAWADPAASPGTAPALMHDLDLELVQVASGQLWQPWTLNSFPHTDSLTQLPTRRADHLNNVEQVTLRAPGAGEYEIRVRGTAVAAGSQSFALAYESSTGFEWINPGGRTSLTPGKAAVLRWQWAGPATATGRLEYQPLGSPQWRTLQTAVPLAPAAYSWSVPDTTTLARLRMVVGNSTFLSDTLLLATPQTPQVGYTCAEETLILWDKVPGARQYQVYQMGPLQLEPFLLTADTALRLSPAQMQNRYYAVAPVVGHFEGARGNTIEFTQQGTACYVRTFLPRTAVTDTVLFDLEVGTLFQLKSASLERLEPGGPKTLQTLTPVPQPQMEFRDLAPQAGRNEYRIRLELTDGRTIYSQTEAVQFTVAGQVQAYPNPVVAGESLRILTAEETPTLIRLYDMVGRLVLTTTDEGAIKTMSTAGLRKGLYILRVQPQSGTELTTRISVL